MMKDPHHSRIIFILIFILSIIGRVQNMRIEAINGTNVKVEKISGRYAVSMDENNHSFENQTLLFLIVLTEEKDKIENMQPQGEDNFKYKIEKQQNTDHQYFFYATQSFDYETQPRTYTFVINSVEEYVGVILTINNIDDEKPSLTTPQCVFDQLKLYNKNDSPCSCQLDDPDGWLGKTRFKLLAVDAKDTDKDINERFAIEFRDPPDDLVYSSKVYVTVNKELNYTDRIFYTFDIQARDSGNNPTTPDKIRGIVYVNDTRSHPPVWTNAIAFYTFEEKSTQEITIQARDGDSGINAPVFYELIRQDHQEENYISLQKENGTITILQINRDKFDLTTFNFTVKAYVEDETSHGPWYTDPLDITLFVTDIDDNPPLFTRMVNTTDPNKITIFDENTKQKFLKISFLENYQESFHVDLFLQDIDTGENAQFDVKLVNTNTSFDFIEAFVIIPNKGYREGIFDISVKNKTNLDYEDPNWRNLQFQVLATGTKDPTKEDVLNVEVSLIDYNDELPKFDKSEYSVEINETEKKDKFIIQVMATDRDAEDKVLKHELVANNNIKDLIRIESDTGKIFVKKDNAFDYDKLNPIVFQVRAIDHVNHKTVVPVTITLLDVDNKPPIITTDTIVQIEENQAIGTHLQTHITATDPDTAANLIAKIDWEKSYARKNSEKLDMTDNEISRRVKFLDLSYEKIYPHDPTKKIIQIDLLINNKNPNETTPDFELFDSLNLQVVVIDLATNPEFKETASSTSATIFINIIDINDNTPYFPENVDDKIKLPNRTVLEQAASGTAVGVIKALDLDVNSNLYYSCQPENDEMDWIIIDSSSGEITVKKSSTIDADIPIDYFNYTCWANDSLHLSNPLKLSIYVLDVNNKIPVIEDMKNLELFEKSPKDYPIAEIKYKDADRDVPFHTVVCRIIEDANAKGSAMCEEQFYISKNIVTVKNGKQHLNRDTGDKFYECTAECKDNPDLIGDRVNTQKINFQIILKDINDNDPILVDPKNKEKLKISENLKKGGQIYKLTGKDIDEGDNAEIVFNITSAIDANNVECKDLFAVQATGVHDKKDDSLKYSIFSAAKDLKDHYGQYRITFGLQDKGQQPRWTTSNIELIINKFNYQKPKFLFPEKEGDTFILYSEQTVDSPLKLFKSSKSLPNIRVSAEKDDVCKKWDIDMKLDQLEPIDLRKMVKVIRIKGCEFQLQITNDYKREDAIEKKFKLSLTATIKDTSNENDLIFDQSDTDEANETEEPRTVNITMFITFMENGEQPIFKTNEWSFELKEADSNLSMDLKYHATYPGSDDPSNIFYYIIPEEENNNDALDYFMIQDHITGKITLKKKLDFLIHTNHTFQIVASNDTHPETSTNPNSKLHVTCKVIEINKNPPVFLSRIFYGGVMVGNKKGSVLTTLTATDADIMDQDHLKYYIIGDVTREGKRIDDIKDPFTVDLQKGEIKLNFDVNSGMDGYFTFEVMVMDQQDQFKNGPFNDTASTTIFILTEEYILRFKFKNVFDDINKIEIKILKVIAAYLDYEPHIQNSGPEPNDPEEKSFMDVYFLDKKKKNMLSSNANNPDVELIKASEILKKLSDLSIYQQIYNDLATMKLQLLGFPVENNKENLDKILINWLIGISVLLGVICIALIIFFILRRRQYNSIIAKLTGKQFPEDLGEQKLDVTAPNTNKHALEGSNPMFSSEGAKSPKDANDFEIDYFDRRSVVSGDSDLVGVEDNPEFDLSFANHINEAKNYI